MLALFCWLSGAVPLTQDNATIFLGPTKHVPVLLALISDVCPECRQISALWTELEQKYQNNPNVLIASIDCVPMKHICDSFPDPLTPSIYWIKSVPSEAEQFFGGHTLFELILFLEKRIAPSVISIQTPDHLNLAIQKYEESSLFFIQNFDPVLTQKLHQLASEFDQFPCYFFHILFDHFNTENPVLINFYFPTNHSSQFTGKFTKSQMRKFINSFIYPPIAMASPFFFSHAKETQSTVLVLADEPPYFLENLKDLMPHVPVRAGVVYCHSNIRLCYNLLIQTGRGPKILLYDPGKRYIWYYRGQLDREEIVEWVGRVMDGGVRAAGPGMGFYGFLGNLFDNAREKGTGAVMVFASIFVVLCVTCVLGSVQSIRARERARKFD
jgi:hypothetical protein